MNQKPTLALTLGDPAGIGPELVEKLLAHPKRPRGVKWKIFGSARKVTPGRPTRRSALAAWQALEEAFAAWKRGEVAGIVTAPIAKENLCKAGFPFDGHTEFFAARCRVPAKSVTMILHSERTLAGGSLTVGLATTHCALREVPRKLSRARLEVAARHLAEFSRRRGVRAPRIAIAALNPHAGEGGLFGSEEKTQLIPWVKQLRAQGLPVTGPHSADTLFHRAAAGEFDAVLALYHDQGLAPFKLAAFHTGVNVTWGLPLVRTSPDHGTAFDIAGTGKADPASLLAAAQLAARLLK